MVNSIYRCFRWPFLLCSLRLVLVGWSYIFIESIQSNCIRRLLLITNNFKCSYRILQCKEWMVMMGVECCIHIIFCVPHVYVWECALGVFRLHFCLLFCVVFGLIYTLCVMIKFMAYIQQAGVYWMGVFLIARFLGISLASSFFMNFNYKGKIFFGRFVVYGVLVVRSSFFRLHRMIFWAYDDIEFNEGLMHKHEWTQSV